MPKWPRDRWRPECVREFRAAARSRYDDGLSLAAQGRCAGAIYMWGYCAEMSHKAAYFALTVAETDPIGWKTHIRPAIDRGRSTHGIFWPNQGAGHNVRAWAERLVLERASTVGKALSPENELRVQTLGVGIRRLWSESLRYHDNRPYPYEVAKVQLAAEWLLINLGPP